ncbi:2-octaprenyl-6-methoxyphenyl hydroxylase [Colwellia sp. D2M02]|uniref:2-octaprenyl-6-methoxyphenyl hydroxylase n=1 Tax=Colwellia sp. D2M02 TaxID=2841562 RepID=UPI001C09AFAB|nr:2-octaprenyl-6-methoxyphenyl hydroxylase [Colwellia sp. D2M02]MBU2893146.1 2-octaprenyl-6-methoxyphenyl hydroxylase [Colwellia sp. D2M02]
MNQHNPQFDIVISGGGLSGSLLALSLSQLTKADGSLLSIAIVEATAYSPKAATSATTHHSSPLFDDRVLALSHGSADYLKKIGVWSLLQADACAIKNIDISDRGYSGKARIAANEYGVSALGYVIDMALIGNAQLQRLAQYSNVTWFSPDTIVDIEWRATEQVTEKSVNQISVKLNSGTQLKTSLLLACDGVQSPCRQLANITVKESHYNQSAIIANVATEHFHHYKAFERFSEFGPIAMLPLPSLVNQQGQGRCSLVWTLPPEQAVNIASLSDDDFKTALELAFGSWLGSITQVGKRSVYPLKLLQAEQQTYHRMALVGNASHTIHPIAGQGFNLGLRDVKVMSELIAQALASQKDIGSFALLQQYQQSRANDQQQVINLTDSLVTLFSNTLTPCVIGRNIGLQALNVIAPFKNALVKKTMGY